MNVSVDFDEIVQLANERAEKMVKNGLYSRFNLSYNQRIEKAKLGCIGEIGFESCLKERNIEYTTDNEDFSERNSDEFDFLIGGKKIDVKVAKKTTVNPPKDSWAYGYPEEQNPISKDYVIVGWVDFKNKNIAFYGWIEGGNIANYSVVTENAFAGYQYLTPNHEFRWGALNKNFTQLFELI